MASVFNSTSSSAQQPDLRSFIVCDRLPQGCAAYPVTNSHHEPLLHAGEWVIVDPEDREVMEGELFVIQWQGGNSGPQVVECGQMPTFSAQAGEPIWAVGARHRGHNAQSLGFGAPGNIVGDFPYKASQLAERFLGKVVGILDPIFVEAARVIA